MKHLNVMSGMALLDLASQDILFPPSGHYLDKWPQFSKFIGGLREHEFTILCGGTGTGKSQWLCNLLSQLIDMNVKCFAAPVETGHSDFMKRILSVYGKFDFNFGDIPGIEMRANLQEVLRDHHDKISKNIFMSTHDNRVKVEEMVDTLKFMSEVHGVKVAVLDNLNFFMNATTAQNQMMEYDRAIHDFVMLCKQIPIHVVMVMHPRKTEGGKVLSEYDIKGSSTAVQEATNILLMNRPSEEEIEAGISPLKREFVFRKIRKRGMYVGRKFWMEYAHGKYQEIVVAKPANSKTNYRSTKASGPWSRVVDEKDGS
jgi:hypothetical protein